MWWTIRKSRNALREHILTRGYNQLEQLRYLPRGCRRRSCRCRRRRRFAWRARQAPPVWPSLNCKGPSRSRHASTRASGDGGLGLRALDYLAYAGSVNLVHHVGGEVGALHQRTAVYPLNAGVPALDAGRVQQFLPHVGDVVRPSRISPGVGSSASPAIRSALTTTSVGFFTLRNCAALKKSELNSKRSTARMS